MYCFVVEMNSKFKIWEEERHMNEGVLAWKSIKWISDKNNKKVAHNIPHFLPFLLEKNKEINEYFCEFKNNTFVKVVPHQWVGGR
jgi:hypothetical protein